MRANEIMRGVLDLLYRIECGLPMPAGQAQPQQTTINMISVPAPTEVPVEVETPVVVEPEVVPVEDDETRRFKQIMDILVAKDQRVQYNNSPNETVTGFNSVTVDAGGGLNGPKNPADLRTNSLSLYPGYQAKG